MVDLFAETSDPPQAQVQDTAGGTTVKLIGYWTLRGFSDRSAAQRDRLRQTINNNIGNPAIHWDLCDISAIDSVGAFFLSRGWDYKRPAHLKLRDEHVPIFKRWAARRVSTDTHQPPPKTPWPVKLARWTQGAFHHSLDFLTLLGQFALDSLFLMRHPGRIPWREISANIYEAGTRALGITALVGLLIGIVVSYLSALELRNFGAEGYIVNVLGVSVLRELGPLLAAIIVAGRSGASLTAELGVMRLTEELDALSSIGISQSRRLILPMIAGLAVALPLLVAWTDLIALAGGVFAAHAALGINYNQLLVRLPEAVPVINFWMGIGKGVIFGFLIALTAGHLGLRIEPNSQSLGRETTNAVVAGITLVIAIDAVFAILLQGVGMPGAG
jgi:phospholipid/cholesterol/gamma-HCH transport system permease protein